MFIIKYYKYKKDGSIYVGSHLPEDVELIETLDILNAEEGYDLIRKSDGENMCTSIWLRNGDTQENYEEVNQEEEYG